MYYFIPIGRGRGRGLGLGLGLGNGLGLGLRPGRPGRRPLSRNKNGNLSSACGENNIRSKNPHSFYRTIQYCTLDSKRSTTVITIFTSKQM
jgi:hypothetical protein